MTTTVEHKYIEQTADDLRYCLAKHVVDPAQFKIIKEIDATWNDFLLQIKILGESHYISLVSNSCSLTEICACTEIKIADVPPVQNDYLHYQQNDITVTVGRLLYRFHYDIVSYASGRERLNQLVYAEKSLNQLYLSHEFSTDAYNGSEAITVVRASLTDNLLVKTVHTYPNEDRLVFTESSITFNDD